MTEVAEIECKILRKTYCAYLIDNGKLKMWLSKSHIIAETNYLNGAVLTIPMWLALNEGLVK